MVENEGEKRHISSLQYFLSGGFGGICTVVSGHPLDTIKVRLQTMPKPPPGSPPLYTSTLDCAKKTIKYEGFRGLYKGMGAPLTGVAPIFAVSFFGYSCGQNIAKLRKDVSERDKPLTNPELFFAGAFSAIFTTTIMGPGERIKTLIQVQQGGGPQKYSGPIDVIRQLYKTGGIKSIYKGTLATLLRDMPGSGMYFMTYEYLKKVLTPEEDSAGVGLLKTTLAGGMAGILYWVVGTPPDVIKSRLQSAPEGKYPHGIRSAFTELWTEGGPLAFYKGVTPVMLRAFFANAACFIGFELANKFIFWSMDQFYK